MLHAIAPLVATGLFLQMWPTASLSAQSEPGNESGDSGLRRAFLKSAVAIDKVCFLATAWQRIQERKNKLPRVVITLRRMSVHSDAVITELSILNKSNDLLRVHLGTVFQRVRHMDFEDTSKNSWTFGEMEEFVSWDWRSDNSFVNIDRNSTAVVQCVDGWSGAHLRLANSAQAKDKDALPKELAYSRDSVDHILVREPGQPDRFHEFHSVGKGIVPVDWHVTSRPKDVRTRLLERQRLGE